MPFRQHRITRAPIGSETREGSIAKLEAAGIFLVFGVFSAATLALACLRRCAGKEKPPETGW